LEAKGGVGILVSGGSNSEGRVPLERFYDALNWVKNNTGLIVNVHTGLLDRRHAEEIASSGVDIVSVDVVGSNDTIRRVYGLWARVENYLETLHVLKEANVPHVVPHICVGLDYGEVKGEIEALKMAEEIKPETIVLLGLIPTPGTPMEGIEPPSKEDFSMIAAKAKTLCPEASVALGCMRPRFEKGEMEELDVEPQIITKEAAELIGKESPPAVLEVERGAIRRYAQAIEDPNPLYNDVEYAKKSKYGEIICPSGFFGLPVKPRDGEEVSLFDQVMDKSGCSTGMDNGGEVEFILPIRAGDVLFSVTKIADIYEEMGRSGNPFLLSIFETTYINQNGDLVAKSRHREIFL